MDEATMQDGVPTTAGWFVVNARHAGWVRPAPCAGLGMGLCGIEPGKPMTLYHREAGQEDFLVLRGECLLVIEGEERPLRAWDLVHCPPQTAHTIVATGAEAALI